MWWWSNSFVYSQAGEHKRKC